MTGLYHFQGDHLTNIYLFKVKNRNTRKSCEILSKLTVNHQKVWRRSSVFIVNFEHILHLYSVSIVDSEQVNVSWAMIFKFPNFFEKFKVFYWSLNFKTPKLSGNSGSLGLIFFFRYDIKLIGCLYVLSMFGLLASCFFAQQISIIYYSLVPDNSPSAY